MALLSAAFIVSSLLHLLGTLLDLPYRQALLDRFIIQLELQFGVIE